MSRPAASSSLARATTSITTNGPDGLRALRDVDPSAARSRTPTSARRVARRSTALCRATSARRRSAKPISRVAMTSCGGSRSKPGRAPRRPVPQVGAGQDVQRGELHACPGRARRRSRSPASTSSAVSPGSPTMRSHSTAIPARLQRGDARARTAPRSKARRHVVERRRADGLRTGLDDWRRPRCAAAPPARRRRARCRPRSVCRRTPARRMRRERCRRASRRRSAVRLKPGR